MKFILGSCSLEDYKESYEQATFITQNGLQYMRAMCWKPRTSADAFQGKGEYGFRTLLELKEKFPELIFVTEVMDPSHIEKLESLGLDFVYQIGTRNCLNYGLLKHLGEYENRDILFKRGMCAQIDEYLGAASYMYPHKNNLWLCLRGIRTFDDSLRNTSDLDAILVLKDRFQYLPDRYKIIFDPSHSSGKRTFVESLSNAAMVLGVDGLEIEIHSNPDDAWSDSKQTIDFKTCERILVNYESLTLKNVDPFTI